MVLFTTTPADITISSDVFYYNRTSDGMESGTIVIDYFHLEIHHGTHIDIFQFSNREYDEDEQIYTFTTTNNREIIFDPSMHTLEVDGYKYFINSTIKSNW